MAFVTSPRIVFAFGLLAFLLPFIPSFVTTPALGVLVGTSAIIFGLHGQRNHRANKIGLGLGFIAILLSLTLFALGQYLLRRGGPIAGQYVHQKAIDFLSKKAINVPLFGGHQGVETTDAQTTEKTR